MRPNIDYRFWILLSWYITVSIQCILGDQQQQTKKSIGYNKYQLKQQPQIADNNNNNRQHNHHQPSTQQQKQHKYIKNIMYIAAADEGKEKKGSFSRSHLIRRNERNFKRDISRIPLTAALIKRIHGVGGGGNDGDDDYDNVNNRAKLVSYYTKKLENVKYENDNNVEGGGDKEFYTEDIYLNDYQLKTQKHGRHRRAPPPATASSSTTVLPPAIISSTLTSKRNQFRNESIFSSSQDKQIQIFDEKQLAPPSTTAAPPPPTTPTNLPPPINQSLVTDNSIQIENKAKFDPITSEKKISNFIQNSLGVDANNKSELLTSEQLNNIIESQNSNEQIIILTSDDVVDGTEVVGADDDDDSISKLSDKQTNNNSDNNLNNSNISNFDDDYMSADEPKVLPLRPIIRGPYDDEHQGEMSIVYAEPHTEVKLNCDVDLDITSTVWMKDGQMVHTTDRNSRPTDNRFIRELRGGLTITNAMLEDDGKWQCEAENARGYVENARPVKLVVLDRPKPPYLLIDSRRLDAGNIFVPVKENSELSLACVSEGGNPKPTLTWEVLLSPGIDRHSQKVAADVLELQEVGSEKLVTSDKDTPYKTNSGAKSEAKMPAVYRAHHNARILCVMEHPTLKMRQNASLLLDVQYTPSFAISRTPGFGYPLREGIEVSLKCDVDSNPPSTPLWQKDDGDTPIPQNGDGFLNFTSIRREHSGWYKCTSRHLNFQYSSIGYYLSIRYDSVDVTSEPLDQDISIAASHNPNKRPQLEVQLGGAVTLQCPQGSLGCWSHLDPVSARLRGLGMGLTTPTGQFSLKDVVYQDAGIYKCIGQSPTNKKKVDVIHTVAVQVKGAPTVATRNLTPVAYPGSPLHLSVEFCANPPAFAARWLHGDRIYTPGTQYGIDVLAYGVIDLPTPFCKEARLTYVHMHERVPRTFHFVVSSPTGVAETIFQVNFTLKHKVMSNSVDDDEEELSEPEEIHFPVFGSSATSSPHHQLHHQHKCSYCKLVITMLIMYFLCNIIKN